MRFINTLPLPVASFLAEETGTSLMEFLLVGLLAIVVGTMLLLALEKCN
ncbi:hypothetical protein [Noviherbaspirillum galbum]|uniref:Uncharacterized protein n=1 Tax=Noviherbaspirillum galbum TaxID=2709383 RepID=A0A6B3SJS1_9BURK|nr:hypothetical protein [Noviherbaspirillum galbum]NEX61037.1 hypothetical protein [Noviherbaspirillum galbum]